MSGPVKVTMKHVRAAKMCSRGARQFFKKHNLNWESFLREGVSSDLLEATGDCMALKVVEVARGRE